MNQSTTFTSVIYSATDLLGELACEYWRSEEVTIEVTEPDYGYGVNCTIDAPSELRLPRWITCQSAHPTHLRAKLMQLLRVWKKSGRRDPAISAEKLGRNIRDRWPLSAAQLLHEPAFRSEAMAAAEAGQKFTQSLLAWEKKAVVMEAVAICAIEVAQKRKEETARHAETARLAREKAEREQPTRDAVLHAYHQCDYREAKQGHTVRVEFVGPTHSPGVKADMLRGDRYSSSCTFPKQASLHVLLVREDWLETVHHRDWAMVEVGDETRLVLSCEEVGHITDLSGIVYRLLTVRQGRGTAIDTEVVRMVRVVATGEERPLSSRDRVVEYTDSRIAHDALIDAGLVAY